MTHPLLAAATDATAAAAAPAVVVMPSATSWTEVATALGACIAAIAALYALIFYRRAARTGGQQVIAAQAQVVAAQAQVAAAQEQTRQAVELERERSRAYVVVFAELSAVSPEIVDVVIANMGATGAHEVRVSASPALDRVPDSGGEEMEAVALPPVIPFLAPGQRWATLWDSSRARYGGHWPVHTVEVTYRDAFGAKQSNVSVLDWKVFDPRIYTDVYGVHHAAKALRGIEKTLGRWSKQDRVVKVATYDGTLRDQQRAANARRSRRWHEDLVGQVMPDPDEGPVARMDGEVS